jgi:hypothetical protein
VAPVEAEGDPELRVGLVAGGDSDLDPVLLDELAEVPFDLELLLEVEAPLEPELLCGEPLDADPALAEVVALLAGTSWATTPAITAVPAAASAAAQRVMRRTRLCARSRRRAADAGLWRMVPAVIGSDSFSTAVSLVGAAKTPARAL